MKKKVINAERPVETKTQVRRARAQSAETIRAEALELFRLLHGPGDGGSESEFNCQNGALSEGWERLARHVLNRESKASKSQSIPGADKSGIKLISDERARQTAEEGWTPKHDDTHRRKEMAHAADSYLAVHIHGDGAGKFKGSQTEPTYNWPWSQRWWRPSDDPVRNLVKAGALIAAEIDRLQRLGDRSPAK